MKSFRFAPVLLVVLCSATAGAQLRWSPRADPPWAVPGRGPLALVAETANPPGLLAFVSLVSQSPRTAETWRYTGGVWSRLTPSRQPDPRFFASMVYDAARDEVVLHGGLVLGGGGTSPAETWIWDGSNWTERSTTPAPPATSLRMAYAPKARRVVLYAEAPRGQTWLWDGAAWSELAIGFGEGPAQRAFAALATTPQGEVVMFGGSDSFGPVDETWILDPTVSPRPWRRLALPVRPGFRDGHAMVFDADRQRVVLHGGRFGFDQILDDTWEFDGERWYAVSPSREGPALFGHAAAYDRGLREVVVVGGSSSPNAASFSQFEYGPTVRPGNRSLGTAECGRMSLGFDSAPILGGVLRILPPPRQGGTLSDVALLSPSLLGAPVRLLNCEFWLGQPAASVAQDSLPGFPPRISVPIPMDPALRGAVVYLQVAGPRVGGFEGIGLSSVFELTIGD